MRGAVASDIAELSNAKKSLTQTKTTAEGKRAELLKQQKILVAQQGSLDATRKAQKRTARANKIAGVEFPGDIAPKTGGKGGL